jgi:hypothetical protein
VIANITRIEGSVPRHLGVHLLHKVVFGNLQMFVQVGCELGLSKEEGRKWWRLRCRSLSKAGRPLTHSSSPDTLPAEDLTDASTGVIEQACSTSPQIKDSTAGHLRKASQVADIVHVQCSESGMEGQASTVGQAASRSGSVDTGWGPPMLVVAIERVQSGLLGETLSSVGITGLYVTLVFGLGRFLRLGLTNIRMRIPYQDLPNVAHLTTLCNDIAVAREEGELLLEEQLFYSLLNIYRSPAVLFEVTKKDS